MHDIVLFCKSYAGDLERSKVLLESINKYNVDNIPFVICVPEEDSQLFKDAGFKSVIHDIDVLGNHIIQNWYTQQIIKMSAWKVLDTYNYIMIDSDSYFIKKFHKKDFLWKDSIPYTVCHEQKELWEYNMIRSNKDRRFREQHHRDHNGFCGTRKIVQNLMKRPGKALDFGPGPVIWNTQVWKELEYWLEKQDKTYEDAIKISPSEFTWYGEMLIKMQSWEDRIPIIPIDPIFKFFHHREEWEDYKEWRITERQLSEHYFGIVMQSNWKAPLKYEENLF